MGWFEGWLVEQSGGGREESRATFGNGIEQKQSQQIEKEAFDDVWRQLVWSSLVGLADYGVLF